VELAIFWGCKRYFAHISPNMFVKLLCDKLSPYKFLGVVHYIFLYQVAIALQTAKFVSLKFGF